MTALCYTLIPFALLGLVVIGIIVHDDYSMRKYRKECNEEKKKEKLNEPYNKNSPMVQRFQKLANINPRHNRYGRFDLSNMC